MGDEVLQIGKFGRDVTAVPVDKVVREPELLSAVLQSGLEVRVEWHFEIGDANADLLVRRRHGRRFVMC